MNRLILFAVVLGLSACASQKPNTTSARAEPSDSDKKAYAYLRAFAEWKEAPAAVLAMCNKSDPSAAVARQTAFDNWAKTYEHDIEPINSLGDDILPQLVPATGQTSLRPSEMFHNATRAQMAMGLAFAPPEKKDHYCKDYPSSKLLGPPPPKEEATTFLQAWLRDHRVSPAEQ